MPPLPFAQKCRKTEEGFAFTVEIDGKEWQAVITPHLLEKLYPNREQSCVTVEQSSQITHMVAGEIKAGNDAEPILLRSTMFDDKGRSARDLPKRGDAK
jgi:hypothetical protein